MELSRRGFIGGLLAVVSAPAIVRVESLMALPRPEVIIPQIETAVEYTLRTNSFLIIDMITREAVRLFMNSNAFLKSIDEQYDREFTATNARIGSTLRIRYPSDFAVKEHPLVIAGEMNMAQSNFASWSRNAA